MNHIEMGFTSDFSEIYIIHRFNYICIITLEPEVNDRDLKDKVHYHWFTDRFQFPLLIVH